MIRRAKNKIGEQKPLLLYRGVFNLGREIIIRRTQAVSPAQAKVNFLRRIIKEKGLIQGTWIYKLFDGHLDNFNIEIEQEDPPATK